jgi:hypothetical protein
MMMLHRSSSLSERLLLDSLQRATTVSFLLLSSARPDKPKSIPRSRHTAHTTQLSSLFDLNHK